MGKDGKKSFRVHVFCSVLVVAFLVSVLVIVALSVAHGAGAGTEIKADPLGRLPASPAEAHKRLEGRKVLWPGGLDGAKGRSVSAVQSGVHVSISYDTVEGYTTHANRSVRVKLIRGVTTIQTVTHTTNANRLFTADLTTGDIQSGDKVEVTDLAGGAAVTVNCTLTGAINTGTDVVSGTTVAGYTIDAYINAPSTYYGDVPPNSVAHVRKTSAGSSWNLGFASIINLRAGDVANIFSTDSRGNQVMQVVNSGGSLVVYPQYDDVMGFYLPGRSLQVRAGTATRAVGTARDGFFEAWFTNYNIVPGNQVRCLMGGSNRSITVAGVTAVCNPATNHVSGTGPANRAMRLTMDPYGTPRVYETTINSQGAFDVALGTRYTATGTDVYNVAWYDSDNDAVVYEFQNFSWYLAEGYTGQGFDTYVLLQNPGAAQAAVTMTFQLQNGTAAPLDVAVPAQSRVTVRLDDLPGLADASVSTKATSTNGVMFNAERAMYFDYKGYKGGHDSIGTISPSATWYLAEGYTGTTPGGGNVDTWVLVQNPGTQDATVTMKFQLQGGTAPDKVFNLPAGTRQSILLNDLPGVGGFSVSTKVTANQPVVAERAMYFNYDGKDDGSDSIGVNSPRKTWYMAEGYTGTTPGGGSFDTWILVQNPGNSSATVTLKFQLQAGAAPDKVFNLPAGTRQSIHLDELEGLSDASVSTKVTSDLDVVAERAMYFNYNGKTGGHTSNATSELSRGWYLPEGYTGTTPGGGNFETWILVQNPGTTDATVRLDFQLPSGTAAPAQMYTLKAGTRMSVLLNSLEGLSGTDVSTRVTSDRPVVAERAVYFDYYGKNGGTDCIGIPFVPVP
jgi:hypothetical protein